MLNLQGILARYADLLIKRGYRNKSYNNKQTTRFTGVTVKEPMLTRALMLNILTSALVIVAGTLYVFMEMMEDGHMTARLVVTLIAC